jgi:hypothetical protein
MDKAEIKFISDLDQIQETTLEALRDLYRDMPVEVALRTHTAFSAIQQIVHDSEHATGAERDVASMLGQIGIIGYLKILELFREWNEQKEN